VETGGRTLWTASRTVRSSGKAAVTVWVMGRIVAQRTGRTNAMIDEGVRVIVRRIGLIDSTSASNRLRRKRK
jgi:hypothetical protein